VHPLLMRLDFRLGYFLHAVHSHSYEITTVKLPT
jgi:hypothetical protein